MIKKYFEKIFPFILYISFLSVVFVPLLYFTVGKDFIEKRKINREKLSKMLTCEELSETEEKINVYKKIAKTIDDKYNKFKFEKESISKECSVVANMFLMGHVNDSDLEFMSLHADRPIGLLDVLGDDELLNILDDVKNISKSPTGSLECQNKRCGCLMNVKILSLFLQDLQTSECKDFSLFLEKVNRDVISKCNVDIFNACIKTPVKE